MTTPSRQDALLVMTAIKPGCEPALATVLGEIDSQGVERNQWVPFAKLRTIHFARWAILPAATDAYCASIPAQLIFASNFDAPRRCHLEELVTVGRSGLDHIYGHCEDYPREPTDQTRLTYLQQHLVPHQAFYLGTPGRTAPQIRHESDLHDAIDSFLDSSRGRQAQMTACQMRKSIGKSMRQRFSWSETRPSPWVSLPVRVLSQVIRRRISFIFLALLLAPFLLSTAPFAIVYLAILRYKESRDEQDTPSHMCSGVAQLAESEDRIIQNQMTAILNITPGMFRLLTLKLVLATVNLLARFANDGFLSGIPSIHFARWAIVDNGRRLLFLSNFDGSWENYLDDFIDKAAAGLTAIWSNTVGFPRTRWLFLKGGARDEQHFKAYARRSQVPTQVWYSAYKTLTVQNINNNSRIRAGLNGVLTEERLREWMRRL